MITRCMFSIISILSIGVTQSLSKMSKKTSQLVYMNFKYPPFIATLSEGHIRIAEGRKNGSFIALIELVANKSYQSQKWSLTSSTDSFRVVHSHGLVWTLNLNVDLDREKREFYNFTIDAVELMNDSSRTPLKLQEHFLFYVTDINDNEPVFEKSIYSTSVTLIDKANPSSNDVLITRIEATDKDEGENARIEYSLDNYDDLFRIDKRSGHFFYRPSLLASVMGGDSSRFDVVIRARDAGPPVLSSTTIMRVVVHSMNNRRNSTSSMNSRESKRRLTIVAICAVAICLVVLVFVLVIISSGILCVYWLKNKIQNTKQVPLDEDDDDTSSARVDITTPPVGCCKKGPKQSGSNKMVVKNDVGTTSTAASACSTGYLSSLVTFNSSPTDHQLLSENHMRCNAQKESPYSNQRVACEKVYTRFYSGKPEIDDRTVGSPCEAPQGLMVRSEATNAQPKCFMNNAFSSSPSDDGCFCSNSNLSSPINSSRTSSVSAMVKASMLPSQPLLSILRANEKSTRINQQKDCSASFV